MEPKRFIGNDLRRLYARINTELGPDAFILRTRSLHREDAEPLIEILAAPPDPALGLSPRLQQAMAESVLARVDPGLTVGDIEDIVSRQSHPNRQPFAMDDATFGEADLLDQLADELQRRSTPMAGPAYSSLVDDPFGAPSATDVSPSGSAAVDIRLALQAAGFSPLALEAASFSAQPGSSPQHAVSMALQRGTLAYPAEDETAIVTIQGPEGAGRTVALLRMALDCHQAGRPARIAATAQTPPGVVSYLRTFARQYRIDFDHLRNSRDVGRLARRSRGATCVFLDVPPGPWRMPLPVGIRHYRYLAVPAPAAPEKLRAAAAPFDIRAFSGAVLTFADTVHTLLSPVDFLLQSGLGVAFVSDGPNPATGVALADPFTLASGSFTTATGVTTDGRLPALA